MIHLTTWTSFTGLILAVKAIGENPKSALRNAVSGKNRSLNYGRFGAGAVGINATGRGGKKGGGLVYVEPYVYASSSSRD